MRISQSQRIDLIRKSQQEVQRWISEEIGTVQDMEQVVADLDRAALGCNRIYTNYRGCVDGVPLDGNLDGWSWQAWSGRYIAYGASADHAILNLRVKLSG